MERELKMTSHAKELREQIEWPGKRNADHAAYLRGFLAIVQAIDNLTERIEWSLYKAREYEERKHQ